MAWPRHYSNAEKSRKRRLCWPTGWMWSSGWLPLTPLRWAFSPRHGWLCCSDRRIVAMTCWRRYSPWARSVAWRGSASCPWESRSACTHCVVGVKLVRRSGEGWRSGFPMWYANSTACWGRSWAWRSEWRESMSTSPRATGRPCWASSTVPMRSLNACAAVAKWSS
ncbi:hypothetical protein D9M68_715160 [compost metagenome]